MSALDNGPDPWAAYIRATMRGYTGGYGNFSDQYYDQYYDYVFNGGGGGVSGGGGGSTSMTFTWHTWHDHNEIIDGVVTVIADKINHSVTVQTSFGTGNNQNIGMNANGAGATLNDINFGIGGAGTFAVASELYVDNIAGKRITYTKFSGTRGWVSTPKVVNFAKNVGTSVIVVNSLINVGLGFSGYLTPGKTITNLGVNWGAWAIGGWPGIVIGVGYTVLDGTGMFDRPAYVTPYSPQNIAVPDALRVAIPIQNTGPIIHP